MDSIPNTIAIQNYLPHRAPMLMVDAITAISESEVETVFQIMPTNILVKNDAFLEVGLIENAAQTCSSIVAQSFFIDENENEIKQVNVIGFISGIKKINVFSLPKSGQIIKTKAALMSRFDAEEYKICTMKCTTFHQDELLFEAEINLFIKENK